MDLVSIAVGIGLVVSLLLSELWGLAAGGMVVPGYLALFLHQPFVILVTLLAALATWLAVGGLSRFAIIYGKRRTTLMILVGFVIGMGVRMLLGALPGSDVPRAPQPVDFTVVGYIIPGLLAIWIDRQGLVETVCTSLTAGCLARLVLIICAVEGIA